MTPCSTPDLTTAEHLHITARIVLLNPWRLRAETWIGAAFDMLATDLMSYDLCSYFFDKGFCRFESICTTPTAESTCRLKL